MPEKLRVRIRGDLAFEAALAQWPALVTMTLTREMKKANAQIEGQAKVYTPVDTGAGVASIGSDVKVTGRGVTGEIGGAAHLAFVEYGTKPHWPPIEALKPWARRHHMSAYAVAAAIAKRGTKAVKMFERATTEQGPNVIARFQRVVATLVQRFGG